MIYSYTCKNFFSIGDKIEVNFEVNKKAPKSNTYTNGDDRVSLIEAIVGPNAAGKTNVIKALAFIKYLLIESGNNNPNKSLPFNTFRGQKGSTELSVKFSINERIFKYDVSLNQEMILSEKIRELTRTNHRVTHKTLFSRTWNSEKNTYDFTDKVFALKKNSTLRRNASIVSHALRTDENNPLAQEITKYWQYSVVHNVWKSGNIDDHYQIHGDKLTQNAIQFFYNNPHLMNTVKDILKNFDVGFHDFEKEVSELEKREIFGIRHRYSDNHEFITPLEDESSGTKRVVAILRHLIAVLTESSGGIAALDEMDAYLHPDIVELLVKLFTSPTSNPNKAQLLFSSHSHQLLSEFDKQQIILVEKSTKGQTDVWRLDQVEGVRADDNYYTKYIAGAYGAKPKLGQ